MQKNDNINKVISATKYSTLPVRKYYTGNTGWLKYFYDYKLIKSTIYKYI